MTAVRYRHPTLPWLVVLAATLTLLLAAAGQPSAGAEQPGQFSDVSPDHTFADEVAWLADQDITQGREDGSFGLGDAVSRGAMAAFLYRFDGESDGPFDAPAFSDVPADHTFAQEIAWLASTGITQGREDGSFGLGDAVSRGAMAAFLYRFDGEPEGPFEAPRFVDVPADHTFAREIAWLASTGITLGREDGSFGVGDAVSRGAMAAFLYRFDTYQRTGQAPPPLTGEVFGMVHDFDLTTSQIVFDRHRLLDGLELLEYFVDIGYTDDIICDGPDGDWERYDGTQDLEDCHPAGAGMAVPAAPPGPVSLPLAPDAELLVLDRTQSSLEPATPEQLAERIERDREFALDGYGNAFHLVIDEAGVVRSMRQQFLP